MPSRTRERSRRYRQGITSDIKKGILKGYGIDLARLQLGTEILATKLKNQKGGPTLGDVNAKKIKDSVKLQDTKLNLS